MGIAYTKLNEIDRAINSFMSAVRIRPDDELSRIALENMAISYLIPENDERRIDLAQYRIDRGKLFEQRNLLSMALLEYRLSIMIHKSSKQGIFSLGTIYKRWGYPMRYLDWLRVIKISDPPADRLERFIADEILRLERGRLNLISTKWKINLNNLISSRKSLSFYIFNLDSQNNSYHPLAEAELTLFFKYILYLFEKMKIAQTANINSFDQGFRIARENNSDFFVILTYNETERSIVIECKLYLSRTGALLYSFNIMKTGNDRIQRALVLIGEKLNNLLPLRGVLFKKEVDRGLIDLGSLYGLKKDDKLIILKKGTVRLRNDQVGYSFDKEDIYGEFIVEAVDEEVAEGRLVKKEFFDYINVGDEVIFMPDIEEESDTLEENFENNLLRNLMELR